MCCAVLYCSVVSNSATPWTADHQAPLFMRILQAGILEWVAMSSSRGLEPRSPTLQVDFFRLSGSPFQVYAMLC